MLNQLEHVPHSRMPYVACLLQGNTSPAIPNQTVRSWWKKWTQCAIDERNGKIQSFEADSQYNSRESKYIK